MGSPFIPAAPRLPAEADGGAETGDASGRADRPSCVAQGRFSAVWSLPPLAWYSLNTWIKDANLTEGSLTHPVVSSASSRPCACIGGGLLQSVSPSWSSEGQRGPSPADSGSRFELNCVFSALGLASTIQRTRLHSNKSNHECVFF